MESGHQSRSSLGSLLMLIWFQLRPLANQPSLREAEIVGQVTVHRDIYEYQLFDLFKS